MHLGARGLTSIEASVVEESRDRFRRFLNMGYMGVEDRYASGVQFCDRVHQEGRALKDCIYDDLMAFGNLPDPPYYILYIIYYILYIIFYILHIIYYMLYIIYCLYIKYCILYVKCYILYIIYYILYISYVILTFIYFI